LAGKVNSQDMTSRGHWSLESPRADGTWATARQSGLIGTIPYTLEMKFYRENPRIDCWMRFRFSGEKIGRVTRDARDAASGFIHEDKLRFKLFPALKEGAVGVRDLPFAISETADPYVNGLYWTAVADGDKGLAVFNRGTMGAVREKDGGFSIPLAYASYYIWGTRMLSGDFEYEFALYPFTGRWADADLHRHALEYNFPVVGVAAPPANGNLTGTFQPVRVESSDAVVSALYSRGGKTFVRVHDYRGTGGSAALSGRGTEVDLAGHDLGAVTSTLMLQAWQLRTVRMTQPIE
jgi:hypothetical protein